MQIKIFIDHSWWFYFVQYFITYRSIEFDEFLEFIIARQGDGRDVHNEIVQVSAYDSKLFYYLTFKYHFWKILYIKCVIFAFPQDIIFYAWKMRTCGMKSKRCCCWMVTALASALTEVTCASKLQEGGRD